MQLHELRERYESLADDELLRLTLHRGDLTEEAAATLATELARRGIDTPQNLDSAHQAEQEWRTDIDRVARQPFYPSLSGIGLRRFGKAGRAHRLNGRVERFRATVFFVLFWVPLFPTGTYIVERPRRCFSKRIRTLEKLPLDWDQILTVWVVSAAILLAALWGLRLLPRLLYR